MMELDLGLVSHGICQNKKRASSFQFSKISACAFSGTRNLSQGKMSLDRVSSGTMPVPRQGRKLLALL